MRLQTVSGCCRGFFFLFRFFGRGRPASLGTVVLPVPIIPAFLPYRLFAAGTSRRLLFLRGLFRRGRLGRSRGRRGCRLCLCGFSFWFSRWLRRRRAYSGSLTRGLRRRRGRCSITLGLCRRHGRSSVRSGFRLRRFSLWRLRLRRCLACGLNFLFLLFFLFFAHSPPLKVIFCPGTSATACRYIRAAAPYQSRPIL